MDQSRINNPAMRAEPQSTAAPARQVEPTVKSRFLSALEQRSPTKERPTQNTGVPVHTLLAIVGSQTSATAPPPAASAPRDLASTELSALLDRACSSMYVSDRSAKDQCVVLSLDPVLAGASAEIVRSGASLRIRLLAQTEDAYRAMSRQRDLLLETLSHDGRPLDIQVVDVQRRHDARSWRDG